MRQLVSTALVACIVGALAGATVSTVAQAPAEPPVSTTALNADTVDRLSAVKATSNKKARANKLVATDSKGFLPANIVKAKWGLIAGKPAFLADGVVGWNEVAGIPGPLADGQVGWNEVADIPTGFADGLDSEGVATIKIVRLAGPSRTVSADSTNIDTVFCPPGGVAIGGGINGLNVGIEDSYPDTPGSWFGRGTDFDGGGGQFAVWVVCALVDPSSAITTANRGKISVASRER